MLAVMSVAGVIAGPSAVLMCAMLDYRPSCKGNDKRLFAKLQKGMLNIGVKEERRQALGLPGPGPRR